jgi:hypothetical protein
MTKTEAVVERPASPSETDRELAHRLRAEEATAAREAGDARRRYRREREKRVELDRHGRLISDAEATGRTLHSAKSSRGVRLIEEELEVAREEQAQRCLDAARALKAATERLRSARIALVAYELPGLLSEHESAVEVVRDADRAAEAAYVAIASTLIARNEARAVEARKARAVVQAVSGTLLDDDARALLRDRGRDEVPAALTSDGEAAEWRDMPVEGLFGLSGQSWDPKHDRFVESLADIVRGGRERVSGTCGSEKVADRITKALNASAV